MTIVQYTLIGFFPLKLVKIQIKVEKFTNLWLIVKNQLKLNKNSCFLILESFACLNQKIPSTDNHLILIFQLIFKQFLYFQ